MRTADIDRVSRDTDVLGLEVDDPRPLSEGFEVLEYDFGALLSSRAKFCDAEARSCNIWSLCSSTGLSVTGDAGDRGDGVGGECSVWCRGCLLLRAPRLRRFDFGLCESPSSSPSRFSSWSLSGSTSAVRVSSTA